MPRYRKTRIAPDEVAKNTHSKYLGVLVAARYARENKVPYLGLCLGMQVMVIELARHALGTEEVNSTEFDPKTPDPVISLLSEQKGVKDMGGTMRLGAYPCKLEADTVAHRAYGTETISERHRHRYEFNNAYMEPLKQAGLRISGLAPSGELVEIVEIEGHPWFLGCQFHPEFKSRPMAPHPLFREFIRAACENAKRRVSS